MGLFESVQLELFEFLGYKKPAQAQPPGPPAPLSLDYPIEITRKPHLRGIRFHISHKGVLKVSANKTSSEQEIQKLLSSHQAWIESQIQRAQAVHARFPQKFWKSGETFSFHGRPYQLIFSPSQTKRPHIRFMEKSFEFFHPQTWAELPHLDFQKKLHEAFLSFFKMKASEDLNERLRFWSEQMKLYPKKVSFRNQKSRWGSCSSQQHISLNWRLIAFDQEVQDYVMVHELAHLTHPNHSKNFWSLVETHMPERKRISKKLHDQAFEADCFLKTSELYEFNPSLNLS